MVCPALAWNRAVNCHFVVRTVNQLRDDVAIDISLKYQVSSSAAWGPGIVCLTRR